MFHFLFSILIALSNFNPSPSPLKSIYFKEKRKIDIPEPSDICVRENKEGYAVVSDKGIVYLVNNDFKVEKKVNGDWMDLEACYDAKEGLWVVDEAMRKLILLDRKNLEELKFVSIPFAGARNKGFESLGFSNISEKYWLATEKQPCLFYELNSQFQVVKQFQIKGIEEVSAITFYQGFWYVLSDENSMIYKCSEEGKLLFSWRVNVHNAEGIAFAGNGDCLVLSDDLATIFFFDPLTE
jgi:hypothetical protein